MKMKIFRVWVDNVDYDEYDSFVVVAESAEAVKRNFRWNESFQEYEYMIVIKKNRSEKRVGFSRWQAPTIEAIHIEEVDLTREQEEEKRRRMAAVAEFKGASLLGERFAAVSFAETKTGENKSFDTAFARCRKYCEKAEEVYENGYGIYLCGDKGTGKTHLAACIVNELSEKLLPAVFTNFSEIAKLALKTPELFDRLCEVDFLVIDDIGAQRVRGKDGDLWMQDKVYEVVNFRYNEMLPTIFTSNYSLGDLVNSCGVAKSTVDRIAEMSSAIIKITGESRRLKARKTELPF